MSCKRMLAMLLVTALIHGADCAVDAHTSPGVGAQQSQHQPQPSVQQGMQSYTLIFCKDGVSKGDVAADKAAMVIGVADTVVATNESALSLMRGRCMVVTKEHDVKVELPNSNTVTVSAHGKAVFSKVGEDVLLLVQSGAATVTGPSVMSKLPCGSAVLIDKISVKNAESETARVAIFSEKMSKHAVEPVRLLGGDHTKFAIKDGNLWLKNHSAFIEMPGGVKLVTPGGTISSARPYTLSCRLVEDALCIENCSPVTPVEMNVKEQTFKLSPFKCCTLKHGDETQAKLPDDGLLRREVIAESDGKLTAMVSEYDPLSLLEAHAELKRAVSKPFTLHQQKTCEALFKSIAVFEELCGDLDSFEENPELRVRSVKGRVSARVSTPALSLASATGPKVQ